MKRALLAAALVAGCGYEPPPATNTASPGYGTDLQACQDAARKQVNDQNAKRALVWFASGVRRWGQIAEATGSCMDKKGYGQLRWCTPAELADGKRSGGVVVTAAGLQCTDPPAAAHRAP